jgi:hypothetical protein
LALGLIVAGVNVSHDGNITLTGGANGIYISPSGVNKGLIYFSAGQNRLYGQPAVPWVIESDAGFKVRNSANTADAALTCGAITASGNVNIGANSLVGTYSGIYNEGKWLTGSDNYGSFYISPNNASFAFAPPAAGAIVGTIDFAGRFNATTGFAVGSHANANTTVRYYRNATGPKASIRAAGGLEVKDLAGSADAALTCGAITASDAVKTGLKLFSALPAASASTDCIFTVTDRSGRPLAKSDGTNWYNVFTGAILT